MIAHDTRISSAMIFNYQPVDKLHVVLRQRANFVRVPNRCPRCGADLREYKIIDRGFDGMWCTACLEE